MIAIGGVGGSGTRVVSDIFSKLGYFMGYDLNDSNDTLLFTLLFKRENILVANSDEFDFCWSIFKKIMSTKQPLTNSEFDYLKKLADEDRTLHSKEWLKERLNFLQSREAISLWGFKEPNSHIVIEKIIRKEKDLKFIYVYRNGLDMAYSSNQNQLKLWGSIFFNNKNILIDPTNSLKYWCMVHKRMESLKEKYIDKIYMLDFDKLCLDKENVLEDMFNFLKIDKKNIEKSATLINAPSSMGRYKNKDINQFYKDDIEYIKNIYTDLEII